VFKSQMGVPWSVLILSGQMVGLSHKISFVGGVG